MNYQGSITTLGTIKIKKRKELLFSFLFLLCGERSERWDLKAGVRRREAGSRKFSAENYL
jgi:hypothetical protein